MDKLNEIKEKTGRERTGVVTSIIHIYEKIRDWMKPSKDQPVVLQVVLFILKLPILIAVLALSPIFLILMIIAFVVAL